MNRRAFVVNGGVAVAGLAMSRLGAAEIARPKIKIGFLGGAHSHGLEKWKTIAAQNDYELVGLCEEAPMVREAYVKLGAKIITWDELFARADVVVVESAVREHARNAKVALFAGKHVHVEKPPAASLAEFEELQKLASTQKRLLQVGYMWRFNPGFLRAFEAARQGWLGDVYLVRATMNSFIDAKRRPEWGEFKGGAMFELGCHLIDAVVRLLGKPVKVTPHLQRLGSDGLADNCAAVIEFAKAQAIVTNSVLHPNAGSHRFLEILGTNGVARVQPIEQPVLTLDLAKAAGPYKAGTQKIELPTYRRYVDEFVELASCLREGKPLPTPPETERLVQETLLRACEML
jgi:predicted dehydrogenase